MRRSLLPLLLLASGCGGRYASTTPLSPPAATLGSASLDLAIVAVPTPGLAAPRATAMAGTGATEGSLTILDTGPVQTGTVEVNATLKPAISPDGRNLTQVLRLRLAHPSALTVGTVLTLDGATSIAQYDELDVLSGIGDGEADNWAATGGTVEVTSRTGSTIALKLTNVTLVASPDIQQLQPITISGTVSGTITYPVG